MKAKVDIREVLKGGMLFSRLSDRELDDLVALCSRRRFDRGQVVFTRGGESDKLYALLSGRVRVLSYSDAGNEIVFRIIEPGEVFGEIGVLDGGERTATAIAGAASQALVVERHALHSLISKNAEFSLKLLSSVAARLRTTTDLLEDLIFLNVPARLAKKLLDLAKIYGIEQDGGTRIDLKLPQEAIGNLIGTSRVSVNQQLGTWKAQGLVSVERSFVTLLDAGRLEEIASGASD